MVDIDDTIIEVHGYTKQGATTSEETFNPAFAPLSEGTLSCWWASSWSPADLAKS